MIGRLDGWLCCGWLDTLSERVPGLSPVGRLDYAQQLLSSPWAACKNYKGTRRHTFDRIDACLTIRTFAVAHAVVAGVCGCVTC